MTYHAWTETKAGPGSVAIGAGGSDDAQIIGYASAWARDLVGDSIMPGAFARGGLRERVPLLYQHQLDKPLGLITRMSEDAKGLAVAGFIVNTALGADCIKLLKAGALGALSIGFNILDAEPVRGGRIIKALDLREVSIVTLPAQELATVALSPSEQAHLRDMFMIETASEHLSQGLELHRLELADMRAAMMREIERLSFGGSTKAERLAEIEAESQSLARLGGHR